MAQLLVRNLDDAVAAALKRTAAGHGRSLEAEVREILGRQVAPDRSAAIERSREFHRRYGKQALPEAAVLIREDRDR